MYDLCSGLSAYFFWLGGLQYRAYSQGVGLRVWGSGFSAEGLGLAV